MSKRGYIKAAFLIMLGCAIPAVTSSPSVAATGAQIRTRAEQALTQLYNQNEVAREFGRKAKGILVFPDITKAGIGIGGSYGEGVLFRLARPDPRRAVFLASAHVHDRRSVAEVPFEQGLGSRGGRFGSRHQGGRRRFDRHDNVTGTDRRIYLRAIRPVVRRVVLGRQVHEDPQVA